MRAGAYEEHECVLTLTASEERAAAGLLKRAISTSSKGIIQLGTGGTPVTFMRITNPHNSTTAVKSRCSELQAIRRVVSGGQPSVLLQNEVLSLGDEQRRALLKEAGISDEIKIGPAEVLAIIVGLAIPRNKIRILRRWLKASNISLACEERMRHASRKAVGENLKGELAPFSFSLPSGGAFSFSLPSGGEVFRGAPLVFIPDLILKADDSYTNLHIALERYKEQLEHLQGMTWRIISMLVLLNPQQEYGNASPSTWPCSTQIPTVNPHSPSKISGIRWSQEKAQQFYNCICEPIFDIHTEQICPPGLHITMGTYTKLFQLFEDFCHSLDLELAFYHTEVDQSRYSLYSQELQRLHQYKVELQEAKQSESVLQQFATYMAVLIGKSNPLTADLLHQSANTSKIVKQLETKIAASTAVVTREFPLNEGPFVKELDMALHSIGVYRQQYFGGTFVGNHVHKTLKEFMELFRTNFPKGTIPIKMHMVEDHAVQWARSTHVGFGLLGEQGAESVHAKFNNLARAYSAIKGKIHQLKCIVAEHLVSIAPHNVAAIPPSKKRKK
eukprot:Em0002g870a